MAMIVRSKYLIASAAAGEQGIVEEGAVYIAKGEIADIGTFALLRKKYPAAAVKGNGRQLMLPGLIDAHSHGWGLSPFQQGFLYDFLEKALLEWPAMVHVDPQLRAMLCAVRHIRNGCTTIHHNHSALDRCELEYIELSLKGYQQAGIRLAFSLGGRNTNVLALDDTAFFETLPVDLQFFAKEMVFNDKKAFSDRYFEIFEQLHKNQNSRHTKVFFGPSWVQGSTDDFLRRVKSRADSLGKIPIHIHTLQTPIQKYYGIRKYGKSLVAHLNDLGLLDDNLVLGHAVYLTEADIELLAEKKVSVTHHPSSNLAMRNGIAPVYFLYKAGVKVAMGIDDKGINDDEDAIMELRLIHKLHRTFDMELKGPPVLDAFDVLCMGTTNAAAVCGFEGCVGELKKGMRADVILVDLDEILNGPWMSPDINIAEVFVQRGKGSHVNTVIVDGEVVMEDRRFPHLDVDALYKEVGAQAERGADRKQRELVAFLTKIRPYYLKWYENWTRMDYEPFYVINSRI